MILSKKRKVTIHGAGSEILADFGCVTASVIDSLVGTGIDIEFAEMVVDEIVATAKKSSAAKNDIEKSTESAKDFLKKILKMEDWLWQQQ